MVEDVAALYRAAERCQWLPRDQEMQMYLKLVCSMCMVKHPFAHTMVLLRAIVEDPPPLVPESAIASARDTYERFRQAPPAKGTEVEDAVIAYGRVVWPFRKAFDALVRSELDAHGDAQFAPRLPAALRPKYQAFRQRGGTLADLHDGARVRGQFTPAELGSLCASLVVARADAAAAVRAAIAADPAEYRRIVREFQALQHELEQHIAALERLVERAADHPDVASEIRETVRNFERGLSHLAREPAVQEVCAAIDAYRERHEALRGSRGGEAHRAIFGGSPR